MNEQQPCAITRIDARSRASDSGLKTARSVPVCTSAVLMAVSTHFGLHPCERNVQLFMHAETQRVASLPALQRGRQLPCTNLCAANSCRSRAQQDTGSCCRQMLHAWGCDTACAAAQLATAPGRLLRDASASMYAVAKVSPAPLVSTAVTCTRSALLSRDTVREQETQF